MERCASYINARRSVLPHCHTSGMPAEAVEASERASIDPAGTDTSLAQTGAASTRNLSGGPSHTPDISPVEASGHF